MSDINWKENAVCYAYCNQFHVGEHNHELVSKANHGCSLEHALKANDFQLNEIVTGDFIPVSELDTEKKYNEVVEVFGLFEFTVPRNNNYFSIKDCEVFKSFCDYVVPDVSLTAGCKRQLNYHQIISIGKLKRMMLERAKCASKTTQDLTTDFTKASSNKYEREITDRQGNSDTVDVYDVIIAYGVTCPATQHAIKKLLCTGDRGHKDTLTDLSEARDAITRAIELN